MPATPAPKPSDRWIPWYFVMFFVALTAILVPMCVIAVRTNSGVVTENAYDKGLAYNKAIEAGKRQKLLNWRGDLAVAPLPQNHVRVLFSLADAAGKPIDGAEAKVWLVRPSQAGRDQNARLESKAHGTYEAELAVPSNGLWEAWVSATAGDDNYQIVKRITLP